MQRESGATSAPSDQARGNLTLGELCELEQRERAGELSEKEKAVLQAARAALWGTAEEAEQRRKAAALVWGTADEAEQRRKAAKVQAGFEYYESLPPAQRRRYGNHTPEQLVVLARREAAPKVSAGALSHARTREHRPARRTASSSRTSSSDPGDDSGPGEPAPLAARAAVAAAWAAILRRRHPDVSWEVAR